MGNVGLPEFARVLKAEGVLQLMFKNGVDVLTVFDRDFGVERSFQLSHAIVLAARPRNTVGECLGV